MKKVSLLSVLFLIMLGLTIGYSQEDPFADLGGGNDDSLEVPDGSSSIRAKRKAIKDAFEGEIVSVKKKTKVFPYVEYVKIKVTKQASSKDELQKKLEVGKTYKFVIVYKEKAGKLDFEDENTQKNLGAWFMKKGDKVRGKMIEMLKKNEFKVEYLERR